MDQTLINSYAEYLSTMGYSKQTIRAYSKVLEQAPETWKADIPQELYEHINSVLDSKQDYFQPATNRSIRPASSLFFMMVTVPSDWSEITAENLRDYISSRFSGLKPSSIGRYVTSLRNFFRFLDYKGNTVNPSVLNLPLAPADWGKSNVPTILSPDEEMRLRAHYKADDEVSIRNNIIVLLMLDLGFRCSEVTNLCITDIHWNNGIIHLSRTKNQHDRELPMSLEIGKLLEDYVMKHRPRTVDEHLLLHKVRSNQYVAMSRESVRGVIRRAFKKENIQGWWKGTHALRRTAASKIYNAGNSLKLTADVLGHESLDSTKQYYVK